jgi:hypothetical protein
MTGRPLAEPPWHVRELLAKAAWDEGFRLERGRAGGWLLFDSAMAPARVAVAALAESGPYLLAVSHAGVAAELADSLDRWTGPMPAGVAASFALPSLDALHRAVGRTWQLAVALPKAPLEQFRRAAGELPRTTEAERLVVQRVGQNIFRDALLAYWGGRCPLTGITDTALLRASHIVPWSVCDTDQKRLDVHNGLLLAAHWDAAFDGGLVSFADDGTALASPALSAAARAALGIDAAPPLSGLRQAHRANLAWHRSNILQAG